MLKKEEIKNDNLVFNQDNDTYHYILDVGNSRDKGDRGISSTPDDELSYSIIDLVTGKYEDGICEHSHTTGNTLRIATVKEVELYMAVLEANALQELSKAKRKYAELEKKIFDFKQKFGNNE